MVVSPKIGAIDSPRPVAAERPSPAAAIASASCQASIRRTSLLGAVGLGDLVAQSEDEYVSIAAGLARDVERLKTIRAGLRERLLASPLCDAAGHAGRFWALVEREWAGVAGN